MGGRGAMTTAPISLQDLQRRLYVKAKAEKDWRLWGLCLPEGQQEAVREAYRMAKGNDGAPGLQGATLEAIEDTGVGVGVAHLQAQHVTSDDLALHEPP